MGTNQSGTNSHRSFRRCIPSEFNRKPRTFSERGYFKGTEFRRILLYDGVKQFKHLENNLYLNFLQLHCAISILSSPQHVQSENMLRIAERLLDQFNVSAEQLFGRSFIAYNVHETFAK